MTIKKGASGFGVERKNHILLPAKQVESGKKTR
jgi:hypothetical protein